MPVIPIAGRRMEIKTNAGTQTGDRLWRQKTVARMTDQERRELNV
jgi:hypothetical protein